MWATQSRENFRHRHRRETNEENLTQEHRSRSDSSVRHRAASSCGRRDGRDERERSGSPERREREPGRDLRRRVSPEQVWQHDRYEGERRREEDGRRRAYLPNDSRTRYEASLEAGLDDGRDAEPYLSEAVRSRRSPPADGRQQPPPHWEPPPQKTPREDWVCGRCQALNFGRRQACFVCSSSREGVQAAGAREVRQRASSTLRVTGLSRHVDGPALQAVFRPVAEVKEVRIVRGPGGPTAPADSAFVVFSSHQEASQALAAVQTHTEALEAQFGPLTIEFAEEGLRGGEAAQVELGPNGVLEGTSWEPASFEEQETGDAEAAAAPVAVDCERPGDGPGSSAVMEARGHGSTTEEASQAPSAAPGFAYDPASGYMYDPGSGYYYDANSGMYCHPSLGVWGTLDGETGAFAPYQEPGLASTGVSSAAEASLAAAHETIEQERRRAAGAATVAASGPGPGAAQTQQPRRSAVIGAAPQLDAQGLFEAARALQQREDEKARAASSAHRPPAAKSAPAPIPATKPAVQGVVHRGKWAQRALQ